MVVEFEGALDPGSASMTVITTIADRTTPEFVTRISRFIHRLPLVVPVADP